jgi:hypothetical protein
MASYTSHFNLKKPAGSDNYDIADQNGNMDKIDSTLTAQGESMAYMSLNNNHEAILKGQFVYIYRHGSLQEGLYRAKSNIAANGTLSSSNVEHILFGGFNQVAYDMSTLSDQIGTYNIGSCESLSSLESNLITIGDSLSNSQVKNIMFSTSTAFGIFEYTNYIGKISKITSSRYIVEVQEAASKGKTITGNYRSSAWTWECVSDQIANKFVIESKTVSLSSGVGDISKSGYIPIAAYVNNATGDWATQIMADTGETYKVRVYYKVDVTQAHAASSLTMKVVYIKT